MVLRQEFIHDNVFGKVNDFTVQLSCCPKIQELKKKEKLIHVPDEMYKEVKLYFFMNTLYLRKMGHYLEKEKLQEEENVEDYFFSLYKVIKGK